MQADATLAITNVYRIGNEEKPRPLVFVGPVHPKTVDYAAKTEGKYQTPFVSIPCVYTPLVTQLFISGLVLPQDLI